jgi:hypothetical protein
MTRVKGREPRAETKNGLSYVLRHTPYAEAPCFLTYSVRHKAYDLPKGAP